MDRSMFARKVLFVIGAIMILGTSTYFTGVEQSPFWTTFTVLMIAWILMIGILNYHFPAKKQPFSNTPAI